MLIDLRFMAKVHKAENGCWLWTAATVKSLGYGRFGFGREVDYAHRASWRIFRGPIPKGMFVCHRCDVRHCVNPGHLFIGSQRENMRDAADKGRIKLPRANYASDETHQVSKLTNDQVQAIRRAELWNGEVRRSFAERFGVTPACVWMARTGRTFKDVQC